MEFERDEFDNEVNTNMENSTNNGEIENSASNDEPKDIDSIIRRHSESLAEAAEDIARNDGSSDTSYDAVQNDVDLNKEAVSSFASNATENLENTQNINISDNKEANNATDSGNFGEDNRGTQSENVRTQTFAAQPQKGKGKGKERKKSKVGRAFGLVASAAVFGLVAGGVMVGVNNVASSYVGTNTKTKADDITIGSQDNAKSESTAAPATNLSSMDVSTIVDKAMPSVVSIYGKEEVTQNSFFGPQSYEAQSSGSGIIVGKTDSELLIVTNNHVIADTTSLEVEFSDGKKATASVKGGDSDNDVAVVAVKLSDMGEDTLSRISIANIGDSDNVKVGQGVVAIGNALGYGQSVTVGYISALNREVKTEGGTSRNLLQTDAAINPGNSGGALLNMQGQVIGINSAKYSDTAVEGMGYAIPISTVKDLIKELSSKETRTVVAQENQGYLGIQGKDIDEEMAKAYDMPQGIYVYKVVEGGAAASSDLKAKDIITKFDGQSVRSMEELKNMLTYYESGRKVDLTVQRLDDSGKYVEKTVSITLGKREAQEQ
ncbi:S1C family serine protease [Lachnoanaerobaculum saburreum]|uniref:PDZ/DHR/GLGF domain protein n=1 Tax=Lachnoanaerobaculum saburreum TaxID=467210 RepID=A0A133ZUW0_9FIRM|nr:trypsin-like peptidase domain-containing protein [Lachnoanaerobaculum saburreum]KXB59218.1 PDZ/DHR/GLGF domain protein [Lachnoanaerobaculum saburreum]